MLRLFPLLLTGCLFYPEHDDWGDPDLCKTDCIEAADVTWSFYPTVKADPQQGACLDDVVSIALVTPERATERYACGLRRGLIEFKQGNAIRAQMLLRDGTIVAETIPQVPIDRKLHVAFYKDAGFLRVTFAACEPGDLSIANAASTIVEPVSCTGGAFVSRAVLAGTYDVTFAGITKPAVIGTYNAVTDVSF